MKCKTCGKEFYNPYVNIEYCSKYCENNDKVKLDGDKFIKDFLGGFKSQK